MCTSREGSTTTACSISDDDDDSGSATKWMLITAFVWLGMMALVWLIYTCRKASRRRRLLKKTLVPLLKLLGLKVTFADDARDEGRGEQPPPYDLVTNSSLRFAGPPTYEEATGRLARGRDVSVHDGSRSIDLNVSTTPQTTPLAASSTSLCLSECDTTQRLASERHVTDDHSPLTAGPSSGDMGSGQMSSIKCLGDANHLLATEADFCRILQLLLQHSSTASVASVHRESSPLPRAPPESYVTIPIYRDDYVTDDHESDQGASVSTHAISLTQSPSSREELDDNELHQPAEDAQLSRMDRSSVAVSGSPFDCVSSGAIATFAAGFDNSTQTDDHEDKQAEKGDTDT